MSATRERCARLATRGVLCNRAASADSAFGSAHQARGRAERAEESSSKRPPPSTSERATSPQRSAPSPPDVVPPGLDYLGQLGDPAVEAVGRQLIANKSYRALGELVASKRQFRDICQPLLREAEGRPTSVGRSGQLVWKDREGRLHRDGDKPAAIYPEGLQEWWSHGLQHREGDQPAVVRAGSLREWWWRGLRHREGDKPAIVWPDGTQEWWWHGKRHRGGDRPAAVWSRKRQEWWSHGKLHREGGLPAIVSPAGSSHP